MSKVYGTCIVYYEFQRNKDEDKWEQAMEYAELCNERWPRSAAQFLDDLKIGFRQSLHAYRIVNVIIG